MKQQLARLQEWFAQLEARERWMVTGGAVVVAATILFFGIWKPLAGAHLARAEALDSERALAGRIEDLAALAQRNQGSGIAVNRSQSLLAAVDQATKSGTLGKQATSIQPEGDREVRVWLEDISFDAMLRWIGELETRHGIAVQNADIERESAPGLVNARLTLVRP